MMTDCEIKAFAEKVADIISTKAHEYDAGEKDRLRFSDGTEWNPHVIAAEGTAKRMIFTKIFQQVHDSERKSFQTAIFKIEVEFVNQHGVLWVTARARCPITGGFFYANESFGDSAVPDIKIQLSAVRLAVLRVATEISEEIK